MTPEIFFARFARELSSFLRQEIRVFFNFFRALRSQNRVSAFFGLQCCFFHIPRALCATEVCSFCAVLLEILFSASSLVIRADEVVCLPTSCSQRNYNFHLFWALCAFCFVCLAFIFHSALFAALFSFVVLLFGNSSGAALFCSALLFCSFVVLCRAQFRILFRFVSFCSFVSVLLRYVSFCAVLFSFHFWFVLFCFTLFCFVSFLSCLLCFVFIVPLILVFCLFFSL